MPRLTQISDNRRSESEGSALLAAVILSVTVCVLTTAALRLVTHEYCFSKNSSDWAQTLNTAEAGVELAMEEFRKYALYGTAWSSWQARSTNIFRLPYTELLTTAGSSSYSRYTVEVNLSGLTITSTAEKDVMSRGDVIERTVQVTVQPETWYPFEHAMLGKGQVTLQGNAGINSFNSADTNKSTNGQYDPAKSSTNASVGSMASSSNAVVGKGNASLAGDIAVSSEGDIDIGGSFSHDGATRNDLDVDIPNVTVPFSTTLTDPAINGTETITVNGSEDMSIPSISLNGNKVLTITGTGTLRIYSAGEVSFTGNSSVNVTPDPVGSDLNIKLYGNDNIFLNSVVNVPGTASKFSVYGTTNCNSIHFTGNDDFIGTIYAPQADISLTGNGNFMGAIVGNTIFNRGTADFHYDEALASNGTPIIVGYEITMWREF